MTASIPPPGVHHASVATALALGEEGILALGGDLADGLSGGASDVRADRASRRIYATDASIYQMEPVCVVFPRTTEDVEYVLGVAALYGVPVLPAAAGPAWPARASTTPSCSTSRRTWGRYWRSTPRRAGPACSRDWSSTLSTAPQRHTASTTPSIPRRGTARRSGAASATTPAARTHRSTARRSTRCSPSRSCCQTAAGRRSSRSPAMRSRRDAGPRASRGRSTARSRPSRAGTPERSRSDSRVSSAASPATTSTSCSEKRSTSRDSWSDQRERSRSSPRPA